MSEIQLPSTSQRWYYGWTIVLAAALLTMITVGMRMSIGPFVIPMSEGLGMSRSHLSAVIAFGMMVYGIGMPIAGYCVNRFGTRTTLIIGAILEMHNLIMLAIALYGLGLVFQLITLPVEIDASKRALNNLNELGLTDNTDASGASRMLRAAAYTYVAGVLSSALEIIRLLAIFGRDRD